MRHNVMKVIKKAEELLKKAHLLYIYRNET